MKSKQILNRDFFIPSQQLTPGAGPTARDRHVVVLLGSQDGWPSQGDFFKIWQKTSFFTGENWETRDDKKKVHRICIYTIYRLYNTYVYTYIYILCGSYIIFDILDTMDLKTPFRILVVVLGGFLDSWVKNPQTRLCPSPDHLTATFTLPKAPENGWLVQMIRFLFGAFRRANFQGRLLLPSRELTYPLPRHFWRWFSFSQGGIS